MNELNRRLLLKAAGASVASLGAGQVAWAKNQAIKVTQAVTSLAYVHNYVALHKGFYASEGLDVELVNTGGGGPDVQMVLAGRAEFTVNDGAQILPAVQQGQKLTCVLSLLNRSLVNVTLKKNVAERLKVSESMPVVDRIRAMKGLKIGVTRPGAFTWQMARYNFISAGMNPDKDAEIIAMGDAPSLAAALRQGAIDAIYISIPIGEMLVAQDLAVTLIDNSKGEDPTLPSFLMEGLWTTPDVIRTNRDLVQKTVNAYQKASAFILQSQLDDLVKTVKPSFSAISDDVLTEGLRRIKNATPSSGAIDGELLDRTQRVLEVNGVMKRKVALAELWDGSFIRPR